MSANPRMPHLPNVPITQDADLTDHSRTCLHCGGVAHLRLARSWLRHRIKPHIRRGPWTRGAPLPASAPFTRHPSAKELASFGLRLHHSHCHRSDTWPGGRLWAKLEFTDARCISHSPRLNSIIARVMSIGRFSYGLRLDQRRSPTLC